MDTATLYELIGYVGSGLVVVSLMMRSLLRLRAVNLVGAAIFTIYGVLIDAPPVWAVNGAIVLIDIYHLWRMLRSDDDAFDILEVAPDSEYLERLLRFHREDIARYQPEFDRVGPQHRVFLILRDMLPVGVFAARADDDSTAVVDLDYVIPGYRDLKPGSFLYRDADVQHRLGVERITSRPGTAAHERYLERVGFVRAGDHLERSLS